MTEQTSSSRSRSEYANRRSSGQRRALSTISTNLAATRVGKHEEVKRRRHDTQESIGDKRELHISEDQENDLRVLSSSVPTNRFSDENLIRQQFGYISADSDGDTSQLLYSEANNKGGRIIEHTDFAANTLDSEVAEEEERVEEDDEEEVTASDNENVEHNPHDGPQEPKWNKAIFSELQQVMQKHADRSLDVTDEDYYDVTMVAEYAPEIFNYLHELEQKLAPYPHYMDNQEELKWEMRSVLIDWVVQVHQRFNLLPETLFLTVNYVDRFLSRRRVLLSRFQLVGAVALFIAAKYEEINCPTVQEVAYMADNAYSIQDFLKAELFMIDVLEFDMGWPGPMSFLRRTSKADDYDYETRTLAKYFLEITIMDYRFVASQPSWLAAGAHYLLRKMLNKGEWTELHVFYSGYTEEQLKPLARIYMEICQNAEVHHKSIFEKYQERRYRRSSLFVQEFLQAVRQSARD